MIKSIKEKVREAGNLGYAESAYLAAYNIASVPCAISYKIRLINIFRILKRNRRWRNKYKGEECYILGNGPSLAAMDLSSLRNKHVFMVNFSYNTDLFAFLKPEFWVGFDKNLFSEAHGKDFESKIEEYADTNFFAHIEAYREDCRHDNLYYAYPTIYSTSDKLCFDIGGGYFNKFTNVIHYAICIALYMGFSKIRLLGCDFTLHARTKHFYDVKQGGDGATQTPYRYLGISLAIRQHMNIYSWCQKNGIDIVNATPGTELEVYPIVDFNNIM